MGGSEKVPIMHRHPLRTSPLESQRLAWARYTLFQCSENNNDTKLVSTIPNGNQLAHATRHNYWQPDLILGSILGHNEGSGERHEPADTSPKTLSFIRPRHRKHAATLPDEPMCSLRCSADAGRTLVLYIPIS